MTKKNETLQRFIVTQYEQAYYYYKRAV